MKDFNHFESADMIIKKIRQGAFLTVQAENGLNTMSIGWAAFGFVWKTQVMMVAVRSTRHTYGIIAQASDFTVSIPSTDMKKATAFCGSNSGRDVDKFKACRLDTMPAQKVSSPVIKTPGIHFECKIIYKSDMDPSNLAPELQDLYPKKDYHRLYFGQIVACYQI